MEILKTNQWAPTTKAYLHSKSTKHKGSFTLPPNIPHPHQEGMLHVVHHSFARCSIPLVNTKSKTCEGMGIKNSFLSLRNQVIAQRGLKSVLPWFRVCRPVYPWRFIYHITNQPSNLFLNKSERERLLPTFTGQVTSCLSLAWLGANRCEYNMITQIYFFSIIDICTNTSSNKQLGSAGREHLPYRCDWLNRFHNTVKPLLWDTFIQRTPLVGDTKFGPRKTST